jgi:hypothetical protein
MESLIGDRFRDPLAAGGDWLETIDNFETEQWVESCTARLTLVPADVHKYLSHK